MFSVPATWKIKISLALPEIVILVGIISAVVHLYNPGVSVLPPILPAPKFKNAGLVRPAASVYAACIFRTAVVSILGLVTRHGRGPAASTVKILPATSGHVKRIAAPVIGLDPISPVTEDL